MRAEMLRLTEDLRKMLSEEWNVEEVASEAGNLIATRVEPPVRELSYRIKSDVKDTGLKYVGQAIKSICLLGFGRLFQDEKTIEKAFADAIGFLGDRIIELPILKADNASSKLVLRIQKAMTEI